MLKSKIKDIVLIIVLIMIVIGILYVNGLVFIQGGPTKNNQLIQKIEGDVELIINKDIEFINSLALNEVYYIFKTDSELIYVSSESKVVEQLTLNSYDQDYWTSIANANGMSNVIIKHGYYDEAIVSLADDKQELIYSLNSKELIFKHER